MKPTPGRIVHFVLPSGPNAGKHRAALITSDWDGPNVNLAVYRDQAGDPTNCHEENPQSYPVEQAPTLRAWSAPYDGTGQAPGSWHWPERELTGGPALGTGLAEPATPAAATDPEPAFRAPTPAPADSPAAPAPAGGE